MLTLNFVSTNGSIKTLDFPVETRISQVEESLARHFPFPIGRLNCRQTALLSNKSLSDFSLHTSDYILVQQRRTEQSPPSSSASSATTSSQTTTSPTSMSSSTTSLMNSTDGTTTPRDEMQTEPSQQQSQQPQQPQQQQPARVLDLSAAFQSLSEAERALRKQREEQLLLNSSKQKFPKVEEIAAAVEQKIRRLPDGHDLKVKLLANQSAAETKPPAVGGGTSTSAELFKLLGIDPRFLNPPSPTVNNTPSNSARSGNNNTTNNSNNEDNEEMSSEGRGDGPLPPLPAMDESALQQLRDFGFSEAAARKALYLNRMSIEQAMNWLLDHSEDADIESPLTEEQIRLIGGSSSVTPDPNLIVALGEMGFSAEDAAAALRVTNNNFDNACAWLVGDRDTEDNAFVSTIMRNPMIQAGMSNPRVLQALVAMTEDPSSARRFLADPEIGPILTEFHRLLSQLHQQSS